MRITLEPTTDQSDCMPSCQQPKVIIEHPLDDLLINDVLNLLCDALVAWGYSDDFFKDIRT